MNISHLQATTAVGRGKICPTQVWGFGEIFLLLLDDAEENFLCSATGKLKSFLWTSSLVYTDDFPAGFIAIDHVPVACCS